MAGREEPASVAESCGVFVAARRLGCRKSAPGLSDSIIRAGEGDFIPCLEELKATRQNLPGGVRARCRSPSR
jgi:hypothetical protein